MSKPVLALALALAVASPAAATPHDELEARAKALREMLSGDVCAQRDQAEALLAAPVAAEGATAPAPTSRPTAAGPADKPLARQDLVDRLHQAVVLVIAGRSTGSGFFVTPDTIVTNNHVVEESGSGPIVVVGTGVSGALPATLVHRTNTKGQNVRDYAILRVQGAHPAVLPLGTATHELTAVVAAGYPGLLLENDMNFRALLRGDRKALPDLALSQGVVMAIQNRERGLPTLAHSAQISAGNSGGPLVDSCGRVVGINTYINVAVQQASSAGFALSSQDLAAYLREHGVAPTLQTGGCGD